MSTQPSARDWKTDFDHYDPTFVADPYPIFDELRRECPVAHTDQHGGHWLATRYEDLVAITHDPSTFSSRQIVISDRPMMSGSAGYGIPPITSDPPDHTASRRMLLPAFSPQRIADWEPRTRQIANDYIDRIIDSEVCDVAVDYARHVPITVISQMLGVPPEDGDQFTHWIQELVEVGIGAPERAASAIMETMAYLGERVVEHRAEPRDDLITYLIDTEVEGKRMENQEIVGTLVLLLFAGIDTTWSSIGSSLWHLAHHPDDLRRLVSEPELMPTAVEEFLRAYSPVTLAREVVQDAVVQGCQMKVGDRVMLSFPSANRDPEIFPDPDKVLLDRAENRHQAFGVGIHRCLGSNLARMEMRVAVEEFIRRIPEFHLADPDAVRWSAGPVRGPRALPIIFDRIA